MSSFKVVTDSDAPESLKYFVLLDSLGFPKGFYPSNIWPTPPQGTIEITHEQYRGYLEGENLGKLKRFQDGELVTATADDLERRQAALSPQ